MPWCWRSFVAARGSVNSGSSARGGGTSWTNRALTFGTINNDRRCPSYEINSIDDLARCVRWNVTTMTGITGARIAIELVAKS